MARLLIACVLVFCYGCSSRPDSFGVDFCEVVSQTERGAAVAPPERVYPSLSLLADGMPFPDFVAIFVAETGLSLTYSARLDEAKVTLSVLGQPADRVLQVVARRLGVELAQNGDIFFLGDLKAEDRSTLVDRLPGLDAEGLRAVLTIQVGEHGRYHVTDDGLVVISDRPEVLARIRLVLDRLRVARPDSWVVQLVVLGLTDRQRIEAGLSIEHVGQVAAAAAGTVTAVDITSTVRGQFSALLRADASSGRSRVRHHPLFLVVPGSPASYRDGQVVPVPRRTVSDQGTVTTVGFDRIQTGSEFSVLLRESAATGALLDLKMSISEVTGYVESAPIVQQQAFELVSRVESGGVFLLGEFQKHRASADSSGPLVPSLFSRSSGAETLTVWALVQRL